MKPPEIDYASYNSSWQIIYKGLPMGGFCDKDGSYAFWQDKDGKRHYVKSDLAARQCITRHLKRRGGTKE